MKKAALLLALLAALVAVAAVAGRWYVGSAEARAVDARISGLRAPVEVWRDSLGVPHLWADDETDLARALGYVHAQDRLWQMELVRRVGEGRLAEVLGPDALPSDRFLRTLGIGRAAREEERGLDAESRRLLQAYADGVNAWIRDHTGPLPPEFLVLGFRPAPWTVANSLVITRIMAWDLADWEVGLDLQRAADRAGPERAREIVPRYPDWGERILPGPAPARPAASASHPIDTGPLPVVPALAAGLLSAASFTNASNSWVIAGSRTRSGRPILANDPHLELRAPSLWHLAALHGGATDVVGVTIPGLPVVVLGHTPTVAWGFTNAMVDDVDFFVERVDPADSTRYQTPAGWERFTVRPETILVKGRDPVVMRVRSTRHGPVLADVEPRAGDRVLAMQWTALQPSTSYIAMRAMNRARNASEFTEALRGFNEPHQNVVFADAAGSIGYRLVGRVPVRRSGDGLFPAPGWTGEADWTGFLPPDQHPRATDPAEGFIVTANNAQTGAGYPHHLGSLYAQPFRAQRIREMILPARGVTAADVARQQVDVVDLLARRYLPQAVRAAEAIRNPGIARELRRWDGAATTDSHAAAVFYVWYEQLRGHIGADEFGGRFVYFPRQALDQILDEGDGAWVDDVRTTRRESLAEMSNASMREAIAVVGSRTWGDIHTVRIAHALGSVELLASALGLNAPAFAAPGSPNTVNVAGYGRLLPFVSTHGASMRHVVDMADPDGAGGFILPTGQSGIPRSPHYADQTSRWREGRLWPIPLDRDRARRAAVSRVTLGP